MLATAVTAGAAAAEGNGLARWRWQRRLLVLFAPNEADPALLQQVNLLAAHGDRAAERDLAVIRVVGDAARSPDGVTLDAVAMRRRFGIGAGRFAAILVGKDGGEKLRDSRPIAADRLFRVIDAMPMRRTEASHPRTRE